MFEGFEHQVAKSVGVGVPGEFAGDEWRVCSEGGAARRIGCELTNGGGEFVGVFGIAEKNRIVEMSEPGADAGAWADDNGKSAGHSLEHGKIERVLERRSNERVGCGVKDSDVGDRGEELDTIGQS